MTSAINLNLLTPIVVSCPIYSSNRVLCHRFQPLHRQGRRFKPHWSVLLPNFACTGRRIQEQVVIRNIHMSTFTPFDIWQLDITTRQDIMRTTGNTINRCHYSFLSKIHRHCFCQLSLRSLQRLPYVARFCRRVLRPKICGGVEAEHHLQAFSTAVSHRGRVRLLRRRRDSRRARTGIPM